MLSFQDVRSVFLKTKVTYGLRMWMPIQFSQGPQRYCQSFASKPLAASISHFVRDRYTLKKSLYLPLTFVALLRKTFWNFTYTRPYACFARKRASTCCPQVRNLCDATPEKVRVIDEKGTNLGVMDLAKAQQLADERGLTIRLVGKVIKSGEMATYKLFSQVEPLERNTIPSNEEKARAKKINLKEIQISSGIGEQDLSWKLRQVEQFLLEKLRVKVIIKQRFRSKIPAEDTFMRLQEEIKNFGSIDGGVKRSPNAIIFYLRPIKKK